jgi:predicted kinase
MMFGGWTGVDRHESAVTTAQHTAVAALLESGWDVVCDDTNLSDRAMNGLRGVAELVGATVEVVDLAGVPPEECERRDARRGDKAVGATVIWGMFERWLKPAEVQP